MVYATSGNSPSRKRVSLSLAFFLPAGWHVNVIIQLISILGDEMEPTLKMRENKIEAWVTEDGLGHHYLGFSFTLSQT